MDSISEIACYLLGTVGFPGTGEACNNQQLARTSESDILAENVIENLRASHEGGFECWWIALAMGYIVICKMRGQTIILDGHVRTTLED